MKRLEPNTKPLLGLSLRRAATVLALGALLSLSACSFVPDWGNPVVWYDSIVGGSLFGGGSDAPPEVDDAEAVQKARGQTASSESKGFPSLGSVPRRAPRTSSSAERQQMVQELVADRDNARYTDQVLRAGDMPKSVTSELKPQPVVSPNSVTPPPARTQRVAKARLPKLDLQSTARTRAAAVPPPPPSAVPRAQAALPAPLPRPIVEPESGSQTRAPYTPLAGDVTDRVATTGASSIVQAPGMTGTVGATPAAPQPVPPVAPVQSAPRSTLEVAALTSVGAEQEVLAQAFARALAESASTVTTTPAGTSFGAPSAEPLTPAQTSVPDIVRETYNEPLMVGSDVAPAATAASGSSLAPAPSDPATVHFGNGSARLNGKAKAVIRDVAGAFRARQGTVRVVGHASHRTRNLPIQQHKLVNFRISLDRATAVANELIRLGVDKNAIQISAVSDSQPVFHESMPKGEAGNRRAEIFYSF